ncbi:MULTISPECIES: RNA polymerase sigma factor [Pirellulaceae]|uniref:RNA polymerase sigma factor n=1 Tax=Pirellulaceae TaxID=2691357 RepID=UPI001E37119C|nr:MULTISPECIES: RNA polymerase sigma factor [Pirellulaceae]
MTASAWLRPGRNRSFSSSLEFALALSAEQFHRLVDQHGPTLYRVAYRLMGNRHDAEDVVQDAFRSVWDSRDRFDAEKGERAWLIAILRRRVVDRWRRKKQPMPLSDHDESTPELVAPAEPEQGFSDEMQAALQCLSEELREAILLVVVGELTHQEAADLLNVPLGTVLSRVSRARKKLHLELSTRLSP